MLHDVSDDDTRDAGPDPGPDAGGWVVRRSAMVVTEFPVYLEPLALTTWCSGLGQRWAERRTIIEGEAGGRIDASTLWVHVDAMTMRPARLPDRFVALFAESAQGRTVSARLALPVSAPPSSEQSVTLWPLRLTDFDVLGHVNNAIAWAMLEELLSDRRDLRAPLEACVEYADAIERHDQVALRVEHGTDRLSAWALVDDRRPAVSLLARRLP